MKEKGQHRLKKRGQERRRGSCPRGGKGPDKEGGGEREALKAQQRETLNDFRKRETNAHGVSHPRLPTGSSAKKGKEGEISRKRRRHCSFYRRV